MNSPEEYLNLIALLEKALEFYADLRNYDGPMGNISMIDLDEHGSQARFALSKSKEMIEANRKMQEDYDRFTLEADSMESSGETNSIDLINLFIQTRDEDNNI